MAQNNLSNGVVVRNTRPEDIPDIIALSARVYGVPVWRADQFHSHLELFPEGQFVAVDEPGGRIVGMAASLIIRWDEYDFEDPWRDFTDGGYFTNHDPEHGKTLYGAEVMVDPASQGKGVGKKLYAARRELCRRLKLARIRAGARLPGYRKHAERMSAEEYVVRVIRGELGDPTLSFQLKQGFQVIAVVEGYLPGDAQSGGFAAVIEWRNPDVPQPDEPPTVSRYHAHLHRPPEPV